MSNRKRTIPFVFTQETISTRRPQSNLDWNVPRKQRTPRSEYRFMRSYALLCTQIPNGGSFGPLNGGVAQ